MEQSAQTWTNEATSGPPTAAGGRGAGIEDDLGRLAGVASELEGVEAALGRIDAGSYGRCATCGEAIDAGALETDPLLLVCAAHR